MPNLHSYLFGKKRGFTLLELLVVISIIGILIAMGAVSYSTAQIKGRNARRRADMHAWGQGMEQYYSSLASPAYIGTCNPGLAIMPGGLPKDPKNDATYNYAGQYCDTNGYCICAKLEGAADGNSNAAPAAGCGGLTAGTGQYFCVKNQQ